MPDSIGMSSSTRKAFIRPATRSPRRSAAGCSKGEEAGGAGVALTAGPAAQLIIHTAGFMPFRANHASRRPRERGFPPASPQRRIPLHPGDRLAQRLNLGVVGGSFLRSGGDAFLQLNHRKGTIAPGLNQITGQLTQA